MTIGKNYAQGGDAPQKAGRAGRAGAELQDKEGQHFQLPQLPLGTTKGWGAHGHGHPAHHSKSRRSPHDETLDMSKADIAAGTKPRQRHGETTKLPQKSLKPTYERGGEDHQQGQHRGPPRKIKKPPSCREARSYCRATLPQDGRQEPCQGPCQGHF